MKIILMFLLILLSFSSLADEKLDVSVFDPKWREIFKVTMKDGTEKILLHTRHTRFKIADHVF